MNNRRFHHDRGQRSDLRGNSARAAPRRRCVLRLERLECRRLLAGLQVSVFIDQDGSRDFDQRSDLVAANRLVFLDADRDGKYTSGEVVRITDELGRAFFEDLSPGNHRVGLLANSDTQQPTTGVEVGAQAEVLFEQPSETPAVQRILSDTSLHNIWTTDGLGQATRLPMTADFRGPSSVDLGGRVVDALLSSDNPAAESHLLLVASPDGSSNRLLMFDSVNGTTHEFRVLGLTEGRRIAGIQQSSQSWLALVDNDGVLAVHDLNIGDSHAVVGEKLADSVVGFSASPSRTGFAAIETIPGEGTRLVLTGRGQSESQVIVFDEVVESLQYSADGQILFASLANGGVHVVAVEASGLERVAILRDAKGPLSSSSVDGRVVTQSRSNAQKLIVWDPDSWLPVGAIRLPSNSQGGVRAMVTDRFGDRAIIATSDATLAAELAVPRPISVVIEEGRQTEIDLGLRLTGENQPPRTRPVERQIVEDSSDQSRVDLGADVLDSDGDQLWFALETPPSHGSLRLTGDGYWDYSPHENYFGQDSAVVRVHDGQAFSDLLLLWDIEAVNDPPLAIHIQLPPISENVSPGTSVGFISIADPDANAEYRITTSDPRFTIEGGQIYFSEGELDFDVEPNVTFQLVATDVENPDYLISTESTLVLEDVNEPPVGIELSLYGDGVAENVSGAAVGTVTVLDPDADAQYEIEVLDDRFEIVGGELRLVDGEQLDFEAAQQLDLTLIATEVGGQAYLISSTAQVPVGNQNEEPISIHLSQTSVAGGVAGAAVGQLVVVDPDGDHFVFSPHDTRFEVRDNLLKLKDDRSIDPDESHLNLTVSAHAANGDQITGVFQLVVRPANPPFQNPVNPYDVNGDGSLTPLDVLEVINDINNGGGGPLPPYRDPGQGTGEDPYMPDVNGDGQVSPIDVLHLVNELNNQNPNGEGEADSENQYSAASQSQIAFTDLESRKRQNSIVDMELERLLDQICRHRLSHDR